MFRCPSIIRSVLRGLGCASVILALCSPGWAAEPVTDQKSTFTAAQRNELKRLIHDYIVENPEVINEAVAALQAKDDAVREEKQKSTITARRQELMEPA